MTLNSAIELGVFDAMAKQGEGAKLSAKDIAAKLCSKNPEAPAMLDRILRLLASHSVVYCSVAKDNQVEMLYSLTPMASQYFVTDAHGVSFGAVMNLIHDNDSLLGKLVYIERNSYGRRDTIQQVHGMHAFEYPSLELRFNEVFNKAVFSFTNIIMMKILETYKGLNMWEEICLKVFLKEMPYLRRWKNCYDAIPEDGRVIVVDFNQADLLMMTQHIVGKEGTKQKFLELATTAGFVDVKFVSHICGTWVMEFFK
ncbi:hypothetical protein L6164_006428 [Bauhinia variegata]|uniref:Uncharacterized protein n=1 Tax=Bauhinia variegata TaxID=167791 RepID=A0ACB9PUD5_BAUVA|nr:hypothetical protein L6164_006428 [Bauhinia variegata]